MSPKFSIIVPVYNVEKYISQCIESVLNQTYSDLELFLVDDESADNSVEICEKYAASDDRIRIIKKPHGGLPQTRNYGIREAKGEYIVLLDGDDFFATDYLEKLAKVLEGSDCDICFGNNIVFYKDNWQERTDFFLYDSNANDSSAADGAKSMDYDACLKLMLNNNKFPACAVLPVYSRRFLKDNGLEYNETRVCAEDLDMFFITLSQAKKICVHDIEFYYYRQDNSGCMNKNMTAAMYMARLDIYTDWYEYYKNQPATDNNKKILSIISANTREQIRDSFEVKASDQDIDKLRQQRIDTHYIWGRADVKKELAQAKRSYLKKKARQDIHKLGHNAKVRARALVGR